MTNGDWIRSMDDDALAKWLDYHIDACCICSHKVGHSCDIPDEGYDCENGRREWLKQEHEDKNHTE